MATARATTTRTRNDIPPVHHDPVDLDVLTEAIVALARHDATCPQCEATLPDTECAERTRLKAAWSRVARRREIREAARMVAVEAVRRSSADHGSAGGQATAEETAR